MSDVLQPQALDKLPIHDRQGFRTTAANFVLEIRYVQRETRALSGDEVIVIEDAPRSFYVIGLKPFMMAGVLLNAVSAYVQNDERRA
jgi:hypothetical protein